jgi:hypothetical protein
VSTVVHHREHRGWDVVVLDSDRARVEVAPGKHTLLTAHTRLPWLADIIPVPWLRSILSIGDLVLAAGLLPFTHGLLRPTPGGDAQQPQGVVLRPLREHVRRDTHSDAPPVAGAARPRRADRRRTPFRRSPRPDPAGR